MNEEMGNEKMEGAPHESGEYASPPAQPLSFSRIEFERVFGGRVLPWIGGLATLLGVVFFMRIAIDGGWLNEEIRTVMAAAGSFLLLLAGVWMHERKGYSEVARASVSLEAAPAPVNAAQVRTLLHVLCADADPAIAPAVLHRIGDEVLQRGAERRGVSHHGRQIGCDRRHRRIVAWIRAGPGIRRGGGTDDARPRGPRGRVPLPALHAARQKPGHR